MNTGKAVEKQKLSYNTGRNINWFSHYEKLWRPKKLKIELPYYPVIALPGIYLETTIIQKDTCTPMFIAALFTTAKTWNNPSVHQQMNACTHVHMHTHTHTHTHTLEYYLAIKKEIIQLPTYSNMSGHRDYHTRWSQKMTNIIWYHLHVKSKI